MTKLLRALTEHLSFFKDLHRVLVIGTAGSGKSSLISQFTDHLEENRIINRQPETMSANTNTKPKRTSCGDGNLVLHFREIVSLEECLPLSPITTYQPDAYIIVYAVNDR